MPIWGKNMGLKPGRTLVYVQQPSAIPEVPRQSFCTLHLAVTRLPESPSAYHIEVDPLRGLTTDERRGLNSQLFCYHMSSHAGVDGVLVIKLRARADGRMYFAFRMHPFLSFSILARGPTARILRQIRTVLAPPPQTISKSVTSRYCQA